MNEFDPKILRKNVLHMAFNGQSVHIPCAFSMIELVSVLFSRHLRFDRKDPRSPSRDLLTLSKGHGVMAIYAAFQQLGWISESDSQNYFKDGSRLRGLSESNIPGLEVTSGSLGHGLPVATGMALGIRRNGEDRQVFCMVGDGEMNEGSMWEALLFAGHHRLDNLTVIVDANEFQAMGRTESILNLEPWLDKFKSFGFEVRECDGHDLLKLDTTFTELSKIRGRPKAVIARTVKGKGVSFMEANNTWHYTRLNEETLQQALVELGT